MEKDKEVKIEKMVLNIEGEKVSLSMDQAKKLKKILDELFGKDVIREVVKEHHYRDWYYQPYKWNYPYVTYCNADNQSIATSFQKASLLADNTFDLEVKI